MRIDLGNADFFGFRNNRRLLDGSCSSEFLVREAGGTLETSAQFAEAIGAAGIATLAMDVLKLRGEFGSAAIIARA